jgi:hypothetical protein
MTYTEGFHLFYSIIPKLRAFSPHKGAQLRDGLTRPGSRMNTRSRAAIVLLSDLVRQGSLPLAFRRQLAIVIVRLQKPCDSLRPVAKLQFESWFTPGLRFATVEIVLQPPHDRVLFLLRPSL